MQVIITNDDHCHVVDNIEDLAPLVEDYMGRDAYYMFRDYIDRVDDMVGYIQEHIKELDALNDTIDNTILGNITKELQVFLEDHFDIEQETGKWL